ARSASLFTSWRRSRLRCFLPWCWCRTKSNSACIFPGSKRNSFGSPAGLWLLPGTSGKSGCPPRHIVSQGGANERLQRLSIDLVTLTKIDGASGVAFEAGVEETRRILQRGPFRESHLHDALVGLAGTYNSGV